MTKGAIAGLLQPYFDIDVLAAFDQIPETYAAHEKNVDGVAERLKAEFNLPSFNVRAAGSYRPEYSFTIWLDKDHKAIPARDGGPSFDRTRMLRTTSISSSVSRAPFITFTSWRRPTQLEEAEEANPPNVARQGSACRLEVQPRDRRAFI